MFLPKRKTARLSGYDYSTPNYYFITICTYQKICIFGKPGQLNSFGKIAENNLLKIPRLNPKIELDKYVIMPNHIHAIFVVRDEKTEKGLENLSVIVGQYKASVTKEIRRLESNKEVWQRSFHDHIIRSQKSYEKIWTYIDNNPLKWEEDCFYCK